MHHSSRVKLRSGARTAGSAARPLFQSCLALAAAVPPQRRADFAIVVDASRDAHASSNPGGGAGYVAACGGPGLDEPFLHSPRIAVALPSLVYSCDRCARILPRLEQVAGETTVTDSSMNEPILVEQQTGEVQVKTERRELIWHMLFSFGMIAGVVAAATMIAHWMRTIS